VSHGISSPCDSRAMFSGGGGESFCFPFAVSSSLGILSSGVRFWLRFAEEFPLLGGSELLTRKALFREHLSSRFRSLREEESHAIGRKLSRGHYKVNALGNK